MDNLVTRTNYIRDTYLTEGAVILVDKPLGWTSFDVVNKIRYVIRHHLKVKKYKVGHAGTLDPLASGLLILCISKYTKQIEKIVAKEKSYEAQITLGADTRSYDKEILPHIYYPYRTVSQQDIDRVVTQYSGSIKQIPPMYSAIKVKGTALYQLARRGEEIERKARPVTISALEISKMDEETLAASIICSKGTYIRTLAYDIGQSLGTGAYLSALRRTAIGSYTVEEAVTVEEFIQQMKLIDKE